MHKKSVQKKANSKNVSLQQTEVRIAPIPSPDDLQRYEEINPGFANRIMTMAEQERIDRNTRADRELEVIAEANKREFSLKNRSIFVSLVVILGFLTLAYFSIQAGFIYSSLGFIGVPLLGIVGYLTFQKRK